MQGPNYVWHCDGNEKIKKFGFCIHGCIDGYGYMSHGATSLLLLYITADFHEEFYG